MKLFSALRILAAVCDSNLFKADCTQYMTFSFILFNLVDIHFICKMKEKSKILVAVFSWS